MLAEMNTGLTQREPRSERGGQDGRGRGEGGPLEKRVKTPHQKRTMNRTGTIFRKIPSTVVTSYRRNLPSADRE